MRKVLVTGSREFADYGIIQRALAAERIPNERLIVIHGMARGADLIADHIATNAFECTVVRVPADWENDGKGAGPERNKAMLALGPDVVLAFFQKGAGNRGTSHCVGAAKYLKIQVKEFWSE